MHPLRKMVSNFFAAKATGAVIMVVLIPVVFYSYTAFTEEILAVDIATPNCCYYWSDCKSQALQTRQTVEVNRDSGFSRICIIEDCIHYVHFLPSALSYLSRFKRGLIRHLNKKIRNHCPSHHKLAHQSNSRIVGRRFPIDLD
jgi:hypothetical protein